MAFRAEKIRRGRLTAGLVLLLVCPTVFGASRFITGGDVTRNDDVAVITIQFACRVAYLGHLPVNRGRQLRVQLDATTICPGSVPSVAKSRDLFRPSNSDLAKLLEVDYDGELATTQTLTFVFTDTVRFEVSYDVGQSRINVRVHLDEPEVVAATQSRSTGGVRVRREPEPGRTYVINLSSSRTPHTAADRILEPASPGLSVFETQVVLAGATWYRLRLGHFKSPDAARLELARLQSTHPTAWIDRTPNDAVSELENSSLTGSKQYAYAPSAALAAIGLDQIDELMADARLAVIAGEVSRAVQIYTKVLRAPNHDRHAEAQEYLGLAREKNGQTAHAKAEYQRYLSLYPDGEGAGRVQQRLAALLATGRQANQPQAVLEGSADRQFRPQPSEWRINTYASQYYRRDANQFNDEDEVISQSALYSDVNIDARRRGSRFDFSSRLSGGYRRDFLNASAGSGNQVRVSYAYADLADPETGLRGRIGRQSRNTGGVLGRFDGLNLDYRATERILVNAVIGQPVFSVADGLDSERTFYGTSISYGPVFEDLEIGLFVIRQDIAGVEDRQAIGTELRYFGTNKSLWGLIDYDTSYGQLSSAFLQGSWRFDSRLTISASIDRRHSPFLSTGSAMIGQPVATFKELLVLMTEDEIRQLSVDRTPLASSYTASVSYSLSPKFQFSVDANQTTVEATPDSGGIAATPESSYSYFSTTLIASSLLKEGDVSMISLRLSDSDNTRVISLALDSRIPIGRRWRINPRIRIDQRRIWSDSSDEWLYTPAVRIQYRHNRSLRIEFEAGKQFAQRALAGPDMNRESYFISLGYQAFF